MAISTESLIDLLIFVSGIVLLIVAVIFLQLYFRYKRRDYFLITFASLAAALEMTFGELDVIFPENWGTELIDLIAAIFSFIMVLLIVIVLIFPDKVPIDFVDKLTRDNNEV